MPPQKRGVGMAGMGGQYGRNKHIFLTANYDTEVQLLSGYESGGGDFIKKPCNDHLLLSKIRVFLDIFDQKQLLIRDNLYLIKTAHQLEKIKTSHKKSEARDRSSIEELESSLLQQQGLRKYIEEVIEKERKAISRELHDDLGQELTAVRLDLAIIKDNCADPDMILKINKVSAHICKIIKSVQRLTLQLRPHILDDLGLESAIEWYTAAFAQRSNIKVYLQIEPEIACSHDISFTVFRIIQESLTNVVRHSKASRVDIMLHHKGHAIHLKIFDNGIGISEFEKRSNKSFGIISMKERAASLGGSLEIEGENGGGTLVKMIIPLNNGNQ
jgi:signal transduction histidine kinase